MAAEFRSRLEQQERQLAAARRQLAEQQTLLEEPLDEEMPQARGGAASDPEAALKQERLRREYESLFADHVAYSVRPRPQPSAATNATVAASAGAAGQLDPLLLASLAVAAQTPNKDPATNRAFDSSSVGVTAREAIREPVVGSKTDEPRSSQLTPPLRSSGGWHRVLEGTILEAVLTTRLDGDFSGPIQAMVTTPVYSHDAQHLLIPAGTRLLGDTRAVNAADQQRLAVSFHRMVFPDGRTLALDRLPGLNQIGESGLRDRVNHHYWSVFGAALAIGAISGLANTDFGLRGDDVVVVRGASTDQAATRILDRYLNRRPTITIREGHRLRVLLTEDVDLPVYEPRAMPSQEGSTRQPGGR